MQKKSSVFPRNDPSRIGNKMTEINATPYVCEGCGTKFDNFYNYCDRYAPYEACPSCMTNEELYELEHGEKK